MQVGDLIKYKGLQEAGEYPYSAVGLCLEEKPDPQYPQLGMRMLVMWFDDYETTYEELDICKKDSWMEIISESR